MRLRDNFTEKKYYVMYQKDGEWQKMYSYPYSYWQAYMIVEFQTSFHGRTVKQVEVSEIDKGDSNDED